MHGGKYTVQTDRQRLSSSVCHSPGGGSLGRHGEELFRFCLGLVVRSFWTWARGDFWDLRRKCQIENDDYNLKIHHVLYEWWKLKSMLLISSPVILALIRSVTHRHVAHCGSLVLQTKRKLFRAKLGWVSPLAEAAWPDGDMIGDTDLQFGSKRNVLWILWG